jgi:low affinity Fe/Cu permease
MSLLTQYATGVPIPVRSGQIDVESNLHCRVRFFVLAPLPLPAHRRVRVPSKGAVMKAVFARFAAQTAAAMGHYWAFIISMFACIVWAVSGPFFGFSDTWQLVINTGTTVLTFLMVFLIQNTRNRDSRAAQLKLDELLRAVQKASNALIDIEESSDDVLEKLKDDYRKQALHSRPHDAHESLDAAGGNGNAAI